MRMGKKRKTNINPSQKSENAIVIIIIINI